MIRYLSIILFFLCVTVSSAIGQNDCTLKLNEAEKLYNEGRIEKIPNLLNPCIRSGFNKENKIAALRLLSLVYLNEDKPEEAENALLQILKMDPEYQVNKTVDDVDYIRLYKLFNTNPIFSIGAQLSFNNSKPLLIETIGTNSFDSVNPDYSSNGIGFGGGIKFTYHFTDKIDATIEPSFYTTSFQNSESVTAVERNEITETINYLSIPIVGTYGVYQINNSLLYAELGIIYNYYVSGTQTVTTTFVNSLNADRNLPSFSTSEIRQKHNFSALLGVGSKVYLHRSYLQLSIRYSFGLNNIVTPYLVNTEDINKAQWNNGHIDSHVRLTHLMFNISYNFEFYKHKRKK